MQTIYIADSLSPKLDVSRSDQITPDQIQIKKHTLKNSLKNWSNAP